MRGQVSTMDLFKEVPQGGITKLDTFKVFPGDLKGFYSQEQTDYEREILRRFEEKYLSDRLAEDEGETGPKAKKLVEFYERKLYDIITD